MDEVQENNNDLVTQVNVSAPGVKVSAVDPELRLASSTQTTSSWNITLTNTALLGTNASLSAGVSVRTTDGFTPGWYVGLTLANFTLEGRGEDYVTVTVVHQARPEPGTYLIPLTGLDVDNGVSYPYNLSLVVPPLPEARFTLDYSVVPVHPLNSTTFEFTLTNDGNGPIGYDLFLESPTGWSAGFDNLGSELGFLRLHRIDGPTRSASDQRHGGASIGQNRGRSRANGDPHRHLANRPGRVHVVGHPHAGHVDPRRWHYPRFQPPHLATRCDGGPFLSLENRGNVDLDLTPSFQLPSGWSVSNALEPISLGWTDTVDVVYTLVGDGSGQSGTLEVRFSDAQGRFTGRHRWTSSNFRSDPRFQSPAA